MTAANNGADNAGLLDALSTRVMVGDGTMGESHIEIVDKAGAGAGETKYVRPQSG